MPILENEKELENYLFELSKRTEPDFEHPLDTYGKMFRQIEIKGYGVTDLISIYSEERYCDKKSVVVHVQIIELKKGKIDLVAVGQISRYVQGIQRIIDANDITREFKKTHIPIEFEITGTLVGNGVADGDVCFLIDSIPWLVCYSYNVSLNKGIEFNLESGWYNTGEDTEHIPLKAEIQRLIISGAKSYRREKRFMDRRRSR